MNCEKALFNKIYNEVFDGGDVFEFGIDEGGSYFVQVKEGVSVEANSDIFLVILLALLSSLSSFQVSVRMHVPFQHLFPSLLRTIFCKTR